MVRSTVEKITRKYYLTPQLMCKIINTTAYTKIGYRMQVIVFDRNWLNEIEGIIQSALNKTYRMYTKGTAVWTIAFNLTPLTNLNAQRYLGSLWRTLQRNNNNLAKNNLLELLSREPKQIKIGEHPKWTEPQDALHTLNLQWFHRDAKINRHPLPMSTPYPSIPSRNRYPKNTVTAWVDGSDQEFEEYRYLAAGLTTNNSFTRMAGKRTTQLHRGGNPIIRSAASHTPTHQNHHSILRFPSGDKSGHQSSTQTI